MRETTFVFLVSLPLALCACDTENMAESALAAPIVVPIRLVDDSPIIEVRVNGTPVDVHFDIGNGANLSLFPSYLNQIEKDQVGTSAGGISMDGPTDGSLPVYEVDLIQIGGLSISNARIDEDYHDEEFQTSFSGRLDAYGFIGRGLFETFKIVIDYQLQELTIIPPDASVELQSACQGKEILLVQGQDWGLVSNADTDIGEVVFVWDTGAPFSVVFKKRTDVGDLGYAKGDTLTLEQFNLNGHQFGPAKFEVLDWGDDLPPFDGFIGYDFFAKNAVCIDFPGNRIIVKE